MSLLLNIGSGQRSFQKPWLNIDMQGRWSPDVIEDGWTYLRGAEEGCAEMIVLHHVLEHHGCGEAGPLVQECARTLRPGGSLLVFVPDMRALAQMWLEGLLSTQVYMTNVYGAFMGDPADRHAWGYDKASLHKFLRECAPWSRVMGFDWRTIPGADIAGPARWILAAEAIR